MLEFVESFRDDYGNLWYRLSLDGTNEGYVLAVNISTGNYDPVFIRPSYNAEIISYKGSEYAVGLRNCLRALKWKSWARSTRPKNTPR